MSTVYGYDFYPSMGKNFKFLICSLGWCTVNRSIKEFSMGDVFVVQYFARARKGGIVPRPPMQVSTKMQAIRMANSARLDGGFAVAIASVSDETFLLAASGDVPDEFLDLPTYDGRG